MVTPWLPSLTMIRIGAFALVAGMPLVGCVAETDLTVIVDASDPLVPVFDVAERDAITFLFVDRCDAVCPEAEREVEPAGVTPVWHLTSAGTGHTSEHPPTPVPLTYGVVPEAVYVGVYGALPAGLPDPAPPLTPGSYLVRVGRTDIALVFGEWGFGSATFAIE